MGVVNVTPDSFSDGGRCARAGGRVAHGRAAARRRRRPPRRRRRVDPAGRDPAAGRRGARPGGPGDHRAGRRRGGRLGRHDARRGRRGGARGRRRDGQRRLRRAGRPRDARRGRRLRRRRTSRCTGAATPTGCSRLAPYDERRRRRGRGRASSASGSRRPGPPASPDDRLVLDPGLGFAKTADHNWALLRRPRPAAGARPPAAGRRQPQVVPRQPAGRRRTGRPGRSTTGRPPAPRSPCCSPSAGSGGSGSTTCARSARRPAPSSGGCRRRSEP